MSGARRVFSPSRGIMVVDIKAFSHNPNAELPDLSASVPDLLRHAFERCDLARVWHERVFGAGTGDGFLLGVQEPDTPYLLDPFVVALQQVLEEEDLKLRTISRELRLRMRMSVHLGQVSDAQDARRGIGTPTNETFRIVDSTAVHDALKRSNPDVTFLAVIVSQRVFDEVVRAGFTPGLHPDEFEPVTAEVAKKQFAQSAWLHIPRPSRNSALGGGNEETPPPPEPETRTPRIGGNVGNLITGGNFNAPVGQSVRDMS